MHQEPRRPTSSIDKKSVGITGRIYYSEQGMQGNNYVSLDVDNKFFKQWNNLKLKTEKIILK